MNFRLGKTHRLMLMIFLTITYFFVELVVGHVCGSVALVADSFHMLSDVLALIVALLAVRMSKKPSDPRHTYGFQRSEILGTLVNTVMLATLCFTIIVEAIQKLFHPEPIRNPELLVYVGLGGLGINLVGIFLFCGADSHGHSHLSSGSRPHEVEDLMKYQSVVIMSSNGGDLKAEYASDPDWQQHASSKPTESERATRSLEDPLLKKGNYLEGRNKRSQPVGRHVNGVVHHPHEVDDDDCHTGHSHQPRRKQAASQMNMRAAFLHIVGDTLGSVVVIVSAMILWKVPPEYDIRQFEPQAVLKNETNGTLACDMEDPERSWKTFIDPSLSLALVVIILSSAIPLLKAAISILMQTVPKEIKLDELRAQLELIPGITKIHDLHVWQLQSDCYIGTVHLRCQDLPEYMRVSQEAKRIFHDFNIHCTTIQPEFIEHSNLVKSRDEISDSQCIIDCGNPCDARTICCATKASDSVKPDNAPSAAAAGSSAQPLKSEEQV